MSHRDPSSVTYIPHERLPETQEEFEKACMVRDVKDYMDGCMGKRDFIYAANTHLNGVIVMPRWWAWYCIAYFIINIIFAIVLVVK